MRRYAIGLYVTAAALAGLAAPYAALGATWIRR